MNVRNTTGNGEQQSETKRESRCQRLPQRDGGRGRKKEKTLAIKSKRANKILTEKRTVQLKKKAMCMRRVRARKKLRESATEVTDESRLDVEEEPPVALAQVMVTVKPEVQRLKEELEEMKKQNAVLTKQLTEKQTTPPVGTLLKRTLSPVTRKKIDRAASSIVDDSPPLKTAMRNLGFNDRVREPRMKELSPLEAQIVEFATENSVPNPDVRRGLGKIDKTTGEREPIRYRISTLKVLHSKFLANGKHDMSFSHFCQIFLKTVIIPKPEDWGTCLCQKCTNPRLKFLALQKLSLSSVPDHPEEAILPNEEIVPQNVTFMKWEKSDMDSRIRKTKKIYMKKAFLNELKNEVNIWTSHLKNALTQFRAIRRAREKAETNGDVKVNSTGAKIFN